MSPFRHGYSQGVIHQKQAHHDRSKAAQREADLQPRHDILDALIVGFGRSDLGGLLRSSHQESQAAGIAWQSR